MGVENFLFGRTLYFPELYVDAEITLFDRTLYLPELYVLVAGVVIVDGTTNREAGVDTNDGTVTFVAGVVVTVKGERYRVLLMYREGEA
ncbi:MAG: hypothetical protein D3924_08115 [Candidatus Electrothrix sp. AR4]|nr:hypothetical protein [Candidatus Electrothrix sp. AR4]